MQFNISPKWQLLIDSIALVEFGIIIALVASPALPDRLFFHREPVAAAGAQSEESIPRFSESYLKASVFSGQDPVALPLRLKIPVINVDAAVEQVGLDGEGKMDVPKRLDTVAWFQLGSHPGDAGSAVMTGHYGIKDGKGSVFDELYKLHKGDIVTVEDDAGASVSFVVRGSRRYDPDADASGVFNSPDGASHLNLITCEGVWDIRTNQYPKRLVVFTDKVTPE